MLAAATPRVDPLELADMARVDADALRDPWARIPLRDLVALYETAARLTGDSALGLHVGARTDFRAYDVLGYVIANSATLRAAFANGARYLPVWTDGVVLEVVDVGSRACLRWEYVDPAIGECRQDCEMSLLALLTIARVLAPRVMPREVHFQHDRPGHGAEHRKWFGNAVSFRMPQNQLVFDAASLDCRLANADSALCAVLTRYADALLPGAPPRQRLVDCVKAAIRRGLPASNGRLDIVARRLGTSARSLERQLNAQGHSFRSLLASVRCTAAREYLADSEATIDDIARRLGYSESSVFHRAFRSWTGTTPRQFRLRRRVDPGRHGPA